MRKLREEEILAFILQRKTITKGLREEEAFEGSSRCWSKLTDELTANIIAGPKDLGNFKVSGIIE